MGNSRDSSRGWWRVEPALSDERDIFSTKWRGGTFQNCDKHLSNCAPGIRKIFWSSQPQNQLPIPDLSLLHVVVYHPRNGAMLLLLLFPPTPGVWRRWQRRRRRLWRRRRKEKGFHGTNGLSRRGSPFGAGEAKVAESSARAEGSDWKVPRLCFPRKRPKFGSKEEEEEEGSLTKVNRRS